MILFFCGAPKNGSHWQRNVVFEALKQKGLPVVEGVGGKEEVFHLHDLAGAEKLLRPLDHDTDEFYLCKGHWAGIREKRLLLSLKNIRVFHIWRDTGDTLVSHYFYRINYHKDRLADFNDYYWRNGGRVELMRLSWYKRQWLTTPDPRVHHTSFSALKTDFTDEAQKMFAFTGLASVDANAVKEATSIAASRKKYKDPKGAFYRKGSLGDHKNIISEKTAEDIRRIEQWDVSPARALYEARTALAHPEFYGYLARKAANRVRG